MAIRSRLLDRSFNRQPEPIDLPGPGPGAASDHESVALVVQQDGTVLWNGGAVSGEELTTRLTAAAAQPEMPVIRFEPEANASYAASVDVINAVADAKLDKFAFVGNERYREFGAD